jgi:hypothetical protein
MALIRLQWCPQYGTLLEQVGKPRHVQRVPQVDFEVVAIPNMVPIEGYTFDQRYVRNVASWACIDCVTAIG